MLHRLLLSALVFLFAVISPLCGQARVQIEHKSALLCLAWSPDGKWLATGTEDGTIRVSEAATGKEIHAFATGHAVVGIVFGPDGKTVAIRQAGQTMSQWELATGKRLRVGGFANYKADQLAFTPDGQTVVAVAHGEFVQWKLSGGASGSKSGNVAGSAAAVAPDGSVGAWADTKGLVRVREYQPMNRTTNLQVDAAHCLAFGPAGKLLAVGDDKGVHLWDWKAQKKITTLAGLSKPAAQLSFAADGHTLAALANDDTSLHIWDLTTDRTRRKFTHHSGAVGSLALSPDGKLLATTGADGKAFIWSTTARELTHKGPALELTEKELAALWTELAGTDPVKAEAAWRKLGAAGDNAIPFLRQQIRAVAIPAVDRKRLEKLLADLDSDTFATRERATNELMDAGEPAIALLQRFLEKPPSLEAERRARQVLDKLSGPVVTPERQRVLEALDLLEQVRTAKALDLLKEIERDALIEQVRVEARQALQRVKEEKK